jgi:hypothetical protein
MIQDDVDMDIAAFNSSNINGTAGNNPADSTAEFEQDPFDEPITQEDAWQVINSYFAEKGLVRQQLGKYICNKHYYTSRHVCFNQCYM